jgi:hypothetical protein
MYYLKSLLTGLFAMASLSALAYNSLAISRPDGSTNYLRIEQEMIIDFNAGNLVLQYKDGQTELPVSAIKAFSLSEAEPDDSGNGQTTGISGLSAPSDLTITHSSTEITVSTDSAAALNCTLADIRGNVLSSEQTFGSYTVVLSELATGVYIFKVNDKAIKILRK